MVATASSHRPGFGALGGSSGSGGCSVFFVYFQAGGCTVLNLDVSSCCLWHMNCTPVFMYVCSVRRFARSYAYAAATFRLHKKDAQYKVLILAGWVLGVYSR